MRLFNTETLCLERFPAESRPLTYRRIGRYGTARFKRTHHATPQNDLPQQQSLPPLSSIWNAAAPARFAHAA